ncbi:MAG: hypothetical protein CMJ83_19715, partial [Planctomycetes bacterium]|nr:hypothetical protein [Planctomycetota bacterium]
MLKMFKRKQDPRAGLAAVLGEFELPGFPMAVMEVLRSLRDPEKDLESIATRVETDPGMSVGVLKMVNSAAFGLASEVDTVGHGLAMLGRARLESLVLGVVVRDVLPKEPAAGF